MRFAILFSPQAEQSFRALPAYQRAAVRNALETHLRHEPTKTSKSRIKRLRKLHQPQYRLRIEEICAFHDVIGQEVQVLEIVPKEQAEAWLDANATPEP